MKDSFYSSFENKHRGSRESIKDRLSAYMPFVFPYRDIYPGETILDLGCGRGEWLEIMKSLEFDGKGIDLDEGMLSYCHDLGLNVEKGDVISFLERIPDDSVAIISSFHLVEHIGFDNVKRLVEESFRVLKPGGLLIMETPNPENIIVSTNNFYLDPTHIVPIPSLLLSFLTEHQGFERTKILRLQEDKSLDTKEDIQIIDVLGGVSPDYSVVAQKRGEPAVLNQLDGAFDADYGIGLQELSNKFNQHLENSFKIRDVKIASLDDAVSKLSLLEYDEKINKIDLIECEIEKIRQQENKAQQSGEFEKLSELFLSHLREENADLKMKLSELSHQLSVESVRRADSENMMNLVYASTSWKLTYPIRAFSRILRYCANVLKVNRLKSFIPRVKSYLKIKLVGFLKFAIRILNRKPKLKGILLRAINKMGIYELARKVYYKSNGQSVLFEQQNYSSTEESDLSPKARDIYKALKKKSSSDIMRNH